MRWLVGIDEVGRGPLAGPVAVGIAVIPFDFDWATLPGVNDSKKLSPINREGVYKKAIALREAGDINFSVVQTSASYIDRQGIVPAIKAAMEKAIKKLSLDPETCEIRLDGSLRAPDIFINQTTIIGGDGLEPVIGLASIVAKVTRDQYMLKMAKKPELMAYDFGTHKGYGTKNHREAIEKWGLSDMHRRSFCRSIQI